MGHAPQRESCNAVEPALAGRWLNDGGTAIVLVSHDDGRVSGTIRFGSDGTVYKPYHLRATVVLRPDGGRGIVGTMPGWPLASTATVWFGELDAAGDTLSTKLLLSDASLPTIDWEAETGGPVFRRAVNRRRQRRGRGGTNRTLSYKNVI